ncbi:DUF305 domain-containing protein [Amnibacterium flavum]|uniref:DUF305 domain-containing protein n=1 Tax=Amnibacterium flavum TaxID=2173173 RepID=A0A2V1HSZ7_9MICO|nr:DUF305 domain-containing protein [Amnibacterium flavum]PVZ95698.1 DUF305 domain-containing protein [Amnibacterium flavum]
MAQAGFDRRFRWSLLIAVAIAAIVAGGIGFAGGRASTLVTPTPTTTSAAAGFARDMQVHHNQGVELAMLEYLRTDDPDVRTLSYDIATTQAQQSGQMYGWLTQWGLPQFSAAPAMSWMGDEHGGHSSAPGESGVMPGMASEESIDELTAATGVEADRIFLTLMIAHHKGAVEMADGALERTDDPSVRALATTISKSQAAEITLMQSMLDALPPS